MNYGGEAAAAKAGVPQAAPLLAELGLATTACCWASRTCGEQAGQHAGETVTIRGWLYNLRESGKLLFPIFRDGTGVIQGVVSLKEQPLAFEALKGLPQESSVIVTGKIQAEPRAPGGYEIHISGIEVVQRVSDSEPYPIQLKEHGVDFLLDKRHLWIRTPRQAAILRIRAEAERTARNYMDSLDYTLTDAPVFTPAACEGTTTLFEVNYIDDQKGLSHAIRPALCRSHRRCARQGLYIRSHVPRRKI